MILKHKISEVEAEIRRLGLQDKWPYDEAARGELARIAMQYGRDVKHLHTTITGIIDRDDACPTPAGLRQLLVPSDDPMYRPWPREPKCARCSDEGWVTAERHGIGAAIPCPGCRAKKPADRQKIAAGDRE